MAFWTRVKGAFSGLGAIGKANKLSAEQITELEEILIAADLGVKYASDIAQAIAREAREIDITKNEAENEAEQEMKLRLLLAREIVRALAPAQKSFVLPDSASRPIVILFAGANGTGKTSAIGKMAHFFRAQNKSVVLAAGDTYRAAAIEQLQIWGERAGVAVVADNIGGDAAALAFRAYEQARAQNADVLLVDSAGRLQNNQDLMAELAKIKRVLAKHDADAPHETLLVLDATTGQNALAQARAFQELISLSGLILTKLDSTARGGVVVPIAQELGLPIYFVSLGEAMEDLHPFDVYGFSAQLADCDEAALRALDQAR